MDLIEYLRNLVVNASLRAIKMTAIRAYIIVISTKRPLEIEATFKQIIRFMTAISD
jgi:hypothetical protein